MKRFYIYVIMGLLSVSCIDFLDVRPENSTTFNNYFRSGKDAEALLNSMMSNLRFAENQDQVHAYAGMKVDNVASDYRGNNVRRARQLAPRTYFTATWQLYYAAIHDADLFLDNAYRFPMSKEIVDIYRLQAYFVKGLCYFWLGRPGVRWPIVPNSESVTEKLGKSSVKPGHGRGDEMGFISH